MIEEPGLVLSVAEDGVLVETIRKSSCGQCSAAKGCGQKMLASIGQGQRFEVIATNPRRLILQKGDQVVLGLAESALLKASFMAYLLPLVLMIVTATFAELAGFSEGVVAVSGIGGLFMGLGVTRWLTGSDRKTRCQQYPEILRTSGSCTSTVS
ncbi:SoxR reducing system RseC family protein [Motiliproteus sp. MSK22-1]|uniref:SoxR reducing system RseC family protein n=1 Tax=Motiliproteus sp. MSK22-1 TaxID=1897630 RepID=UPI0009778CD0|nr:SoxR reducing system RseC family protein [Motiliproteus sp. MSK22-1]OMH38120.1 hypothetical protein BGP75_07560 [Motiliproteus sp. MSK22-1]